MICLIFSLVISALQLLARRLFTFEAENSVIESRGQAATGAGRAKSLSASADSPWDGLGEDAYANRKSAETRGLLSLCVSPWRVAAPMISHRSSADARPPISMSSPSSGTIMAANVLLHYHPQIKKMMVVRRPDRGRGARSMLVRSLGSARWHHNYLTLPVGTGMIRIYHCSISARILGRCRGILMLGGLVRLT